MHSVRATDATFAAPAGLPTAKSVSQGLASRRTSVADTDVSSMRSMPRVRQPSQASTQRASPTKEDAKPTKVRTRVDLPEPLAPTRPVMVAGVRAKVASASTGVRG